MEGAVRRHGRVERAPALAGIPLPDRLGAPGPAGAIVTKGGLVFMGSGDTALYAFDKVSGREICGCATYRSRSSHADDFPELIWQAIRGDCHRARRPYRPRGVCFGVIHPHQRRRIMRQRSCAGKKHRPSPPARPVVEGSSLSKTPAKGSGGNGTVADQVAEFIGRTMGELLNKKDSLNKQMAEVDDQIADIRKRVVSQFGALVPPVSRGRRAVKSAARRSALPRPALARSRKRREPRWPKRHAAAGPGSAARSASHHPAERPAPDNRRPVRVTPYPARAHEASVSPLETRCSGRAASHQRHQCRRENQRNDNRSEAAQPVGKEEEHTALIARRVPARGIVGEFCVVS